MDGNEIRQMLIDFALYISGVWAADNEDDVASAAQCVDEFLEQRVT